MCFIAAIGSIAGGKALRVTCYELRDAGYALRVARYALHVAGCELSVAGNNEFTFVLSLVSQ